MRGSKSFLNCNSENNSHIFIPKYETLKKVYYYHTTYFSKDTSSNIHNEAYQVTRKSIIHPQTLFVQGTVCCESSEVDPEWPASFFI